ncbi:MAG: hypothetical protein ACOVO1_11825 [Chitinophagaceae bacterium]
MKLIKLKVNTTSVIFFSALFVLIICFYGNKKTDFVEVFSQSTQSVITNKNNSSSKTDFEMIFPLIKLK